MLFVRLDFNIGFYIRVVFIIVEWRWVGIGVSLCCGFFVIGCGVSGLVGLMCVVIVNCEGKKS